MRSRLSRSLAGLFALSVLSGGCAAIQASQKSPGVIANGAFSPTRAASAKYGADPARVCKTTALDAVLADLAVEAQKTGKPAAEPDGRLCAMAEALLGWDQPGPVPDSVLRFLSAYFGVENTVRQVIIDSIDTMAVDADTDREIAEHMVDPLTKLSQVSPHPRFGFVNVRQTRAVEQAKTTGTPGRQRIVLVMQGALVDIQPLPRKLEPGGHATLSGKLLVPAANAKVLISDPLGKTQSADIGGDGAFQADLTCGDKAGRIQVEIQGEVGGVLRTAAAFPVSCGVELATAVPLPQTEAGGDAAAAEKKLLDGVNAERVAAGLKPLVVDDATAGVARGASEHFRDDAVKGTPPVPTDVAGLLKEAGVTSTVLLVNPGEAASVADAQVTFGETAHFRANYLNPEITHAGIGVAWGKLQDGRSNAFVTQIFIRQLPVIDTAAVREQLRAAVGEKRHSANLGSLNKDAKLEDIAQTYATELAAAKGALPKAREDAIVAPLYKGYKAVNIMAGGMIEPLAVAADSGVLGKATLIGIGVAQGTHPQHGKNTPFVVILMGSKK